MNKMENNLRKMEKHITDIFHKNIEWKLRFNMENCMYTKLGKCSIKGYWRGLGDEITIRAKDEIQKDIK